MYGVELIEKIRQSKDYDKMVLIILTSAKRNRDASRCAKLGITAYMMKPVKKSDLMDTIARSFGELEQDDRQSSEDEYSSANETQPSLKVLLVEDNMINQRLACRLLEKHGHEITLADNGLEALEELEKNGYEYFDAVLMDVQMPEMDGLEATRTIRKREKDTKTHIPIIAMTAHAMKGDKKRCLNAGMDDYISKPVDARQLNKALLSLSTHPPHTESHEEQEEELLQPEEAVDLSAILNNIDGDREFLNEIVSAFLEQSSELMTDIKTAVAENDNEALEFTAHTLKGAVANFGAEIVKETAFKLEQMGRNNDLSQAEAVYQNLEEEMDRVRTALAEEKAEEVL